MLLQFLLGKKQGLETNESNITQEIVILQQPVWETVWQICETLTVMHNKEQILYDINIWLDIVFV